MTDNGVERAWEEIKVNITTAATKAIGIKGINVKRR